MQKKYLITGWLGPGSVFSEAVRENGRKREIGENKKEV